MTDDENTGRSTRAMPAFVRSQISSDDRHNRDVEQRGRVVKLAAPPPKHSRRPQ